MGSSWPHTWAECMWPSSLGARAFCLSWADCLPFSAQPQQAVGFKFLRPPANSSFKTLRMASSTSLGPICILYRPHLSLSLIPALSKSLLGRSFHLQGQVWGPLHLSLGLWGRAIQPAQRLVVRQAGQPLLLNRSSATQHPLASSVLTCRPCLLPLPTSGQSVVETLQTMEVR